MPFYMLLLRCQAGASASEYALILAIVGSALVLGVIFLGGSIEGALDNASTRIADCEDGAC